MTENLTEKLIDTLYKIGLEDATSKIQWKLFCENAKEGNIQLNYEILYTILEVNECMRKNSFEDANTIITNDASLNTEENIEQAKKGLKLLEYGKLYLKENLVREGSTKVKNSESWRNYCTTLTPETSYFVIESVLQTAETIEDGKNSFKGAKNKFLSNKENLFNIRPICDGLKYFKNGNDFVRFLKERNNSTSNKQHKYTHTK